VDLVAAPRQALGYFADVVAPPERSERVIAAAM